MGRSLDVFFRDSAARTRPRHAAQVDALLLGEAPGHGRNLLPFAVLLFRRTPDHIQRGLCGRADFGSIVRPALRVLLAAASFGAGVLLLRARRHRLFGLRDVRLSVGGLRLGRLRARRLSFLLWFGGFGLLLWRSEEHTSELQSHSDLVCRLLLEKKKRTMRKRECECDRR